MVKIIDKVETITDRRISAVSSYTYEEYRIAIAVMNTPANAASSIERRTRYVVIQR